MAYMHCPSKARALPAGPHPRGGLPGLWPPFSGLGAQLTASKVSVAEGVSEYIWALEPRVTAGPAKWGSEGLRREG